VAIKGVVKFVLLVGFLTAAGSYGLRSPVICLYLLAVGEALKHAYGYHESSGIVVDDTT
jgi:hypothetical protein